MAIAVLFAALTFPGTVRTEHPAGGFVRHTVDIGGQALRISEPLRPVQPYKFTFIADPGVTDADLLRFREDWYVSNGWFLVSCPMATGDSERDFAAFTNGFEKAIGLGLSSLVNLTGAKTETGRAFEKRFRPVPRRPAPESRCFRSAAVEAKIAEVAAKLTNPKLREMFVKCFPNTLDTTVHYRRTADGDDETFVYTGDIPAMWLRDSAAQVWPYLPLMKDDEPLRRMIRGVVRKQFELIRLDPYANAFNDLPWDVANEPGEKMDGVVVKKGVFERKYELDSLCYPIRLAYEYWRLTGDATVFDAKGVETLRLILGTMRVEQHKEDWKTTYFFARPAVCCNARANGGWGLQVKPVGLIASAFRPSDDACTYPFLIPSNLMASDVLGKAQEVFETVAPDAALAAACKAFKAEVDAALLRHGVREHPTAGRIWAFEVDGFGSVNFMDDANVPSLLAIPYFTDIAKDDPVYRATRRFVWSTEDPWFFRGKAGEGIGGPHCPYGRIWPMSMILRALTTDAADEIRESLRMILSTDAGKGLVHETFDKDDASRFSRFWFAWANTLFGELIVKLADEGRFDILNSL